ncbi:MAG: DMT family transporter [Kiritimatiellae bacterium]|nr:DMT family transporter [Kiritimatiellia bacterium]
MNSWTGLIIASAVFLAFYDLAKKASVRDNAVLPVLLVSTLSGAVAFSIALAAGGKLRDALLGGGGTVLALSAAKSAIVATSWVFTFCALRTLPITVATPIRASAPALVFVMALFAYGEIPSWMQAAGMLCVFAGYWAFSWAGRAEGISFFRCRAVWYAFAGAFFSALSAIWDKYVFQKAGANVESVQLYFQAFLVAVYLSMIAAQRALKLRRDRFEWRWTIPLVGVMLAAADWLYFTALAVPGVPVSIASLLRRFSVVVTFAFGARIFREANLRRKAIALAIVLAGVALLCIGG